MSAKMGSSGLLFPSGRRSTERSNLPGLFCRAIALWIAGCSCGWGLALASEDPGSSHCQRVIADASVVGDLFFESDGTTLSPNAPRELLQLTVKLQRFPPAQRLIVFTGYQSAVEREGIALYRAEVARRFFLSRGLAVSATVIDGRTTTAVAHSFGARPSGQRVEYEARAWQEFCAPPEWNKQEPR